ncbi:Vi polysaccharide export inner membrane protein VexD [Hartmannibacter diazotrophicus]|uniref:Vi polysaccharide export inner membrane protein VexD n=1 Tax=Hartmannibacter diazotrophicus TaxID=1482074 RepID=A0A2C9D3Q8_9HYPH|nr:capsule biosynthesis protein [Hartmannibacter diazotrophicus]SON54431.1 Vi polysaccharide export inner membrane protein VexD [Hartmannibacter diazotrophicus]
MLKKTEHRVPTKSVIELEASELPAPAPSRHGRLARFFDRAVPAKGDARTAPQTQTSAGWRFPRPPLYMTTFILFVVIPSLASLLYLAFIASNQYEAVSRFAVRTAVGELPVELPESGQGGSPNLTGVSYVVGQDAYIIVSYIRSSAILQDLSGSVDLDAIFRSPRADFWARLKKDAKAEELLAYWNGMVSASVDGPSGIVTIRVRAFTPEDARTLLEAIIRASEELANTVSKRARDDLVQRVEIEVRQAEGAVRKALGDLQKYREDVGYIDPVKTATMNGQLLLQLLGEKIRLESEYFVSSRMTSENAPGLKSKRALLQTVTDQIDKLKASLTGSADTNDSIAASLVRYETLELHRVFAEKLLSSSQDALERAKRKADRQQIYISVFVPPSLPEESGYPQRLAMSFIIPVSLMVVWGIFALLVATIDDHRY